MAGPPFAAPVPRSYRHTNTTAKTGGKQDARVPEQKCAGTSGPARPPCPRTRAPRRTRRRQDAAGPRPRTPPEAPGWPPAPAAPAARPARGPAARPMARPRPARSGPRPCGRPGPARAPARARAPRARHASPKFPRSSATRARQSEKGGGNSPRCRARGGEAAVPGCRARSPALEAKRRSGEEVWRSASFAMDRRCASCGWGRQVHTSRRGRAEGQQSVCSRESQLAPPPYSPNYPHKNSVRAGSMPPTLRRCALKFQSRALLLLLRVARL